MFATSSAKQIVGEAILNYQNGRRNGEIAFHSNITALLIELRGEYYNDKRAGIWPYVYNGNKGVVKYSDSGWELSKYTNDTATGSKLKGANINMYNLSFGRISLAELQNLIANIIDNSVIIELWSD